GGGVARGGVARHRGLGVAQGGVELGGGARGGGGLRGGAGRVGIARGAGLGPGGLGGRRRQRIVEAPGQDRGDRSEAAERERPAVEGPAEGAGRDARPGARRDARTAAGSGAIVGRGGDHGPRALWHDRAPRGPQVGTGTAAARRATAARRSGPSTAWTSTPSSSVGSVGSAVT